MTGSTLPRRPSRYPGSPPFEDRELDRRLFFGRTDDAESILHSILSHDLFVLYARSGIGKTSVLKAGVMEHLRERNMWPILVRLHDTNRSPLDLVRSALVDAGSDPRIEVLGIDDDTTELWDLLTGVEVWNIEDDALLLPVLIFDQFEELFTLWDASRRESFIEQFASVVRHVPRPLDGEEQTGRSRAPRVKFVLSLREDFLGGLEAFSSQLPQILTHRQRLQPLTRSQAEDAIREPALLAEDLDSPRFTYDDRTVAMILDFLSESQRDETGYSTDAEIEAFQLQILCHHIETVVLPEKSAISEASADAADPPGGLPRITPEDIGQRDGLRLILKRNYSREIEAVSSSRERRKLRRLCEIGLISDGRRRFVAKDEIQRGYRVTDEQLDRLVDARLLRVEPRGRSAYYELAHDSLVAPLLQYRAEKTRRARWWAIGIAAVLVALIVGAVVASIATRSSSSDGPQVLRVGDGPVSGSVEGALDLDVFQVVVGDGEIAALSLRSLSGNAQIEVFDPESSAGASSNEDQTPIGTATAAGAAVLLPEPGAYTAIVRASGNGSAAEYTLGLDRLEPSPITVDQTKVGVIGTDDGGPLDVFQFSADGDEAHTIALNPLGALDGNIQVIGPDGVRLAVVDNVGAGRSESLTIPVFDAGDFYVVVRGVRGSEGNYSLRLQRSTIAVLDAGTPQTGEVKVPGEVDVFTLAPGLDDVVSVTVESSGELDGVVELIDPDGQRVARLDSTGRGDAEELTTVVLPGDAEVYLLSVEGAGESTGGYTVRLTTSVATELERGQLLPGALDQPGGVDHYRFSGVVGDAVTLEVSGDVDVVAGLIDPSGAVVSLVDESDDGGAETITTILTRGGTYILEIAGYADSTGAYRVGLDGSPSTPLDGETPSDLSIDSAGSVDVFTFSGSASDAVTFTVTPDDGLRVSLEILDPSGKRLAQQLSPGSGERLTTTEILPQSGTYIAKVAGSGESVGGYGFAIVSVPVDVLTTDGAISGSIEQAGDEHVFTFSGSTDDVMALTMRVDPELNGIIELIGPNGDQVEAVDTEAAGGDETLTSLLPEGGTYVVRVRGFNDSFGAYTMQLRRAPVGRLKLGADLDGSLDEAEVDVFEMSGTAGDVVTLTLRPGDQLDGTLTVINSDGEIFAEAEARGVAGDESLTIVYPDDDVYRTLVRGAESTLGSYTVSLRSAVVTPIAIGTTQSGAIDDPSEVDAYSFGGSTDEIVSITLSPDAGLDGQLSVVDPNADQLASLDDLKDQAATETITLILPQGGSYTVLVRGFVSTGSYTLTVDASVIDAIEYGDSRDGSIDDPQAFDAYTFLGSQGEVPTITVVPAASLNVVVEVIDPTGGETQVVDANGPGAVEGFTLTLPEDRDYFIRIRGASGSTGTYELTLNPPAN